MVDEYKKPHVVIDEESFYLEIKKIDETTMHFIETWYYYRMGKKGIEDAPEVILTEVPRQVPTEVPTQVPIKTSKKVPAEIPKKSYHKKIHAAFIELTEKHCHRCDKTKPVSDFNKSKQDRTGYQSYCRSCSNEINSGNKKIRKKETEIEQPVIIEPVKKKTLSWTKERDKIICDNFSEHGVSGIYDKSLLPGFSLTEIRHRCQELGLIDSFGNPIENRGGNKQ